MKNYTAIIAGEPESINSELIIKSWKKLSNHNKKRIFIIGSYKLIKSQLGKIKLRAKIERIESINEIKNSIYLKVLDVPIKFKNSFKIKKRDNLKYIFKCFDVAHKLAMQNKITGFVNCPVDKKKLFGFKKDGVTEFLAKKNKIKDLFIMLIHNKKLSVTPLTTHQPLKDVSSKINSKLIKNKIFVIDKFYKQVFKKRPIIAVLGLNPHNAELRNNSEESKIIIPTLKLLRKKNRNILGPFPADTIFSIRKKIKYDVILGMYHDQVLAPFKAIYNFDAINITLGLKYLRASPDHGTGSDLIGKNKGNPKSLLKSINFILEYTND